MDEASLRPLYLLLSALALAMGLTFSNGALDDRALLALSLSLVFALLAISGVPRPRVEPSRVSAFIFGAPVLRGAAALAVAFQAYRVLSIPPGVYLRPTADNPYTVYLGGAALLVALGGMAVLAPGRWGRGLVVALVAVYLTLGFWLLRVSPSPMIDVFVFQRDSVQALQHGVNPYAIDFPNIYGRVDWYGPNLVQNGRLLFGYPYPPLTLEMVVPAMVLGADPRYAQLFALAATALLLAFARPGALGPLAAALLLLCPRGLFVLEQSWTEPLVLFFLALFLFASYRSKDPRRLWPAVTAGLFFVSKQYLVVVLPLLFWQLPREGGARAKIRYLLLAAGVGAAVSLPLALWSFPAFLHSVVTLQMHQPFRPDALSYLAFIHRSTNTEPTAGFAFLAALGGLALAWWRAPRTPVGFAAGSVLVLMLFFAFNKQAFCNYYFLCVGGLLAALACCAPDPLELTDGAVLAAPVASAPPSVVAGAPS